MNLKDITALSNRYILPTYGRFDISFNEGKGSYLWEDKNHRYLDFCTGIATCSLGHCPEKVTQALQKQLNQLWHCSNLYQIENQAILAKILVEKIVQLPGKVFFGNSGAEAIEGLIKLTRRFGQHHPSASGKPRHKIIAFQNSFHGRTLGSLSATGQSKIQSGFSPLAPEFIHLPLNNIDALKTAIDEEVIAILLEPIQGEGGVQLTQSSFLTAIQQLCKQHNLLLLLDEIQCGLGRTGSLCAWKKIAPLVKPDGIAWAKGLGGGLPIGSFWVSDCSQNDSKLTDLLPAGSHGSTFGGNPLVCVAAIAVLNEILEQNLTANCTELGTFIKQTITQWNHPLIKEVRGLGLLLGIELETHHFPSIDSPALFVVKSLIESKLLTVSAGKEVIRLLPPLNLSRKEAQQALDILKTTFDRLLASNSVS